MIIAELSIITLGTTTSQSTTVNLVLTTLHKEKNITIYPNAMATVIQAPDLTTLLTAVHHAHTAVATTGAPRIITTLKIDDRHDKNATVETKLKSISH